MGFATARRAGPRVAGRQSPHVDSRGSAVPSMPVSASDVTATRSLVPSQRQQASTTAPSKRLAALRGLARRQRPPRRPPRMCSACACNLRPTNATSGGNRTATTTASASATPGAAHGANLSANSTSGTTTGAHASRNTTAGATLDTAQDERREFNSGHDASGPNAASNATNARTTRLPGRMLPLRTATPSRWRRPWRSMRRIRSRAKPATPTSATTTPSADAHGDQSRRTAAAGRTPASLRRL